MYQIVFVFFYLISLLPWRVLYGISNVVTFFLRDVVGYRKDVVLQNIAMAFPEKDAAWHKNVAHKFYRNFCDNWIETIKLLSVSKESLSKRMSGNFDVLNELHASGKAVQANLGHFFNWEIMTLYTGISSPYTFLTVYLPQSSKIFNRFLLYLRGRWGNPLLPSTEMARAIMPWRKKQYLLALGADQTPPGGDAGYWLYFLNQPTVFVKGPEKFARSQGIPVVMMTTTRPKRGHYHFDYFLLAENTKALSEGELMRQYAQHLESNIRLQPEIYLWSHRRWKHGWKPEFAPLWVDNKPMP